MMLSDGTIDYLVAGRDISVSLSMPLERKDISGQTSGTESVSAGNKSKKLTVSLSLRMDDAIKLRGLTAIAEAIDEAGAPIIYTISDDLAEAMNIRQVEFVDKFRVDPLTGTQGWTVRFSLQERMSIPEKKEQRAQQPETTATATEGEPVASTEAASTPASADPQAEELTGVESILSYMDEMLAPDPEATEDQQGTSNATA